MESTTPHNEKSNQNTKNVESEKSTLQPLVNKSPVLNFTLEGSQLPNSTESPHLNANGEDSSTPPPEPGTPAPLELKNRNDANLNENAIKNLQTSSILDVTRNTPLKQLRRIPDHFNLKCRIFAKCEYVGRTGSIKDRVAEQMIAEAEKNEKFGSCSNLTTILVPYSASLAIALAQISAVKGYYVVAILTDSACSTTGRDLLRALGGEIILANYVDIPHMIAELITSVPNTHLFSEYQDLSSVATFYDKMAQEIIAELGTEISLVVCNQEATGLAEIMKKYAKDCKTVGVMLADSDSVGDKDEKRHFFNVMDSIYTIPSKDTLNMARSMISAEALIPHASGGAVLCGALTAANALGLSENENAVIVIILDDSLQTCDPLFLDDSWLRSIKVETGSRHWWNDMTVGRLELKNPWQVHKTMAVSKALEAMQTNETEELIVVDDDNGGKIMGVTTKILLETNLALANAYANPKSTEAESETESEPDTLENETVVSPDFVIIGIGATLGEVAEAMKTAYYFIITMKQHFVTAENDALEHRDIIVGFFTPVEVLKYTSGIEEHHKLNLETDLNQPVILYDPTSAQLTK